jgi:hypothetical protein
LDRQQADHTSRPRSQTTLAAVTEGRELARSLAPSRWTLDVDRWQISERLFIAGMAAAIGIVATWRALVHPGVSVGAGSSCGRDPDD